MRAHGTHPSSLRALPAFLATALLCACTGGNGGVDALDGGPGIDTPGADEAAPPDTEPEAVEYGEIALSVFPPEPFCGCAPGGISWQDEDSIGCGWHLGSAMSFRVRAEHSALGFTGTEGIQKVKLWQHWPTGTDGILLKTLTKPTDGLFVFQVALSQLDLADPQDGTYWLRVEVESKISGPDGLPMTRDLVIPFDVDTAGPTLQVISPPVGAKLSGEAALVLKAGDGQGRSGLKSLQAFIQDGQGQWDALDVSFPVTDPGTEGLFNASLDLEDFDTQDTTLRFQGEDCLGNLRTVDVPVRIIAIPRFVAPTVLTPDSEADYVSIQAVQVDGGDSGAPGAAALDLLLAGTEGAWVAWGLGGGIFTPPALVGPGEDLLDARAQDMTGDGVPDLVTLTTPVSNGSSWVTLWTQDTGTPGSQDGLRTFQSKEKREVQPSAQKLDLADLTGDGRPDILVVGSEETETLAVVLHTGKVAGVPGGAPSYLGYANVYFGATGGADVGHADVNDDGFVDAIVGRDGAGAITAFLNNGLGVFPIGVDSPMSGLGSAPLLVTNVHISDSAADVIVYNNSLQAFIVFENAGNGYFDTPGLSLGMTEEEWGNEYGGSQIPLDGLAFDEELESGRLVLVGADLHAFVLGDFNGDGVRDLAATTPADKMVRIFTARPQGAFEAEFFQDRFLNGGDSPGPLAAADFNEDGVDDLAVVSTSLGQVTLLLSEDGGFHATLELPMPLKPTWAAGQIVPAGGLVADFGRPPGSGTALPDDREDLLIYTEPVPQRWLLPGEEDEPEVKISSVTLLFTYLGLGSPVGPDYAPVKASVSHRMTAPLSGAATGDFDGDGFPDVVVATRTAPDSLTTGGNFDILRGGLNPLVTQPTGNGTEVEHGVAGRFWPLGGFIGPENPSGVATARLNGDVLDDLVFIAPESGSISDPATFQYAKAVGLLTRYNKGWNSCPGSYNQVSFLCCAPEDTALPCPPSVDDLCLSFTPNVCEGAQSQMNALGKDPTAVAVDLINGDDVPDVVVVNRASFNFTYFQGLRQGDQYLFQSPQEPPNLYPIGADPIDIDIGNLDDDGLPDVVAALSSSIVVIYGRDEPLHEFELGIPLDKGPDSQDMTPSGVLMADVNMDGYVDIVASSTHKSLIWIYISAGDRAFLGPFPFDCGRDPVDVLRIDFDVDGCPDLAVVNAGSKTVSLLRNERCD